MAANKKGWQGFLNLCTQLDSVEELDELFGLFFTLEEKEILASRFLIIKDLLEGELPQRAISEKNKVSIAQITRGSNALKIISPRLKKKLQTELEKIPK